MSITLASDTLRTGPRKPVHRFILYLLAGNADHNGELAISVAELCALSGIDQVRRVQRIVGNLEQEGWLSRIPRYDASGAQLPNCIRVNVEALSLSPRSETNTASEQSIPPGVKTVTPPGDKIDTPPVTVLTPPGDSFDTPLVAHSMESGATVGQNGHKTGQNGAEMGVKIEPPFDFSQNGPIYIYRSSSDLEEEKKEEEKIYIEGGVGGDETAEAEPGWWLAWREQALEEKSRADLLGRHLDHVIEFLEKPAQARKAPAWAQAWMVTKLREEWPEAADNPRFMAAYMAWFMFRRSFGGKAGKLTVYVWSQNFPGLKKNVSAYPNPVLEAAGWLYLGISKNWQGVPQRSWVEEERAKRNGRGYNARVQTQMAAQPQEWDDFVLAMRNYGLVDLSPPHHHALAALQEYWRASGGSGDVVFALAGRDEEFAPVVARALAEYIGENCR